MKPSTPTPPPVAAIVTDVAANLNRAAAELYTVAGIVAELRDNATTIGAAVALSEHLGHLQAAARTIHNTAKELTP